MAGWDDPIRDRSAESDSILKHLEKKLVISTHTRLRHCSCNKSPSTKDIAIWDQSIMNVIRKKRRKGERNNILKSGSYANCYIPVSVNWQRESIFSEIHPPQNLNRRCQSCQQNPLEGDFNKRSLKKLLQLLEENWIPRLLHRVPFMFVWGKDLI